MFAEDLVSRKPAPDQQFNFSSSQFELLAEWRSVLDRSIEVCLPGFSKDGHLAIVLTSVPWGLHSVPTSQILSIRDGVWIVVRRHHGAVDFMSVG